MDNIVNEEYQKYIMITKDVPILDFEKRPLEWWKDNRFTSPLLSEVAKEISCLTIASGALERDFCFPSQFFTRERGSLDPYFGSMLTVMKVNFADLPEMSQVKIETTEDNMQSRILSRQKLFDPLKYIEEKEQEQPG